MFAIYKKEMQSFFFSPIAYVFMGFFLFVTGTFFAMTNVFQGVADYNGMLSNMTFLFMLLVPILTMRIMSEERKNKTDQLLLTAPVSITAMVLGKYLAALSVFFITLCLSLMYPVILFAYGTPSFAEIFTGYIGFFLLGASLIAVGVFISALSENQVTSATSTFGVLLLMQLGSAGMVISILRFQWLADAINWLSVYTRFETTFTQGILGLSPVVYFISFIATFLFLTIRTVERRRWSEV